MSSQVKNLETRNCFVILSLVMVKNSRYERGNLIMNNTIMKKTMLLLAFCFMAMISLSACAPKATNTQAKADASKNESKSDSTKTQETKNQSEEPSEVSWNLIDRENISSILIFYEGKTVKEVTDFSEYEEILKECENLISKNNIDGLTDENISRKPGSEKWVERSDESEIAIEINFKQPIELNLMESYDKTERKAENTVAIFLRNRSSNFGTGNLLGYTNGEENNQGDILYSIYALKDFGDLKPKLIEKTAEK